MTETQQVDKLAKIVWNYLKLNQKIVKSDAILALGSIDTRVAERAVQLFLDGYGDKLIFSGGLGKLSIGKFPKPEAEVFADIAVKMGVPKNKIIVENKSTNTGDNIAFTYALLERLGKLPESLILVQKPYMERRTYATFKKQWPDNKAKFTVTSPQIDYDDYFNDNCPKEMTLNIMVGDLQRIKEYPARGFQISQDVPDDVWGAYVELVKLGYNKQLIQ